MDAPTANDRPQLDGGDIRKVASPDVGAVASALAEAFYDDPHFRFFVPDDSKRMVRLERGFRTFITRLWLRHDEGYTNAQVSGAAIWLPPGTWHVGFFEQLLMLPAIAGNLLSGTPRFLRAFAMIERKHPRTPAHWYLPVIGVAPAWQGRGYGAALLRPALERCDHEGVPAYLEASTKRNCALYERHGFAKLEECRYASNGPPLWRMWREPAS